ncbi:hypothetical protein [Methylobacter sp.]|uniref:hypothetical protein n=1 Tax=Methylobacter sp. TaxID=2051955 RepID=UPI003DA3D456
MNRHNDRLDKIYNDFDQLIKNTSHFDSRPTIDTGSHSSQPATAAQFGAAGRIILNAAAGLSQ